MSRCTPHGGRHEPFAYAGVATTTHGPPPWLVHMSRGRHPMGPGFGGPGRGGPRGRRGPRARRGDVRAAILRLLAEEPRTGYALMQEIERRTNGVWTPSAGSIYPALALLEDEGLVRSAERDGRKSFELTDEGRVAEEERSGERAPWDVVTGEVDDDSLALMHTARQFGMAVMQVSQIGSPEQLRAAREILSDARRKLFALLAEEEPSGAEPDADAEQ